VNRRGPGLSVMLLFRRDSAKRPLTAIDEAEREMKQGEVSPLRSSDISSVLPKPGFYFVYQGFAPVYGAAAIKRTQRRLSIFDIGCFYSESPTKEFRNRSPC
jgi:hypothetical protein